MLKAAELAQANRDELARRLRPAFARRGPWLQAGKYIDALSSDIPRKNGWTIAEHAGDRSPDKTQRLLNHAVWDEREAMAAVREFVIGRLGGPDAVAVLDETGQEKKGERTAGAKRNTSAAPARSPTPSTSSAAPTPATAATPSSTPAPTCPKNGPPTPPAARKPASPMTWS
jgi:DDE superfamily endonuclease